MSTIHAIQSTLRSSPRNNVILQCLRTCTLRNTIQSHTRNISATTTIHANANANADSNKNASTRLPSPTWSLQDLNLLQQQHSQSQSSKIENEELDKLAQRCLLDIQHLSNERREDLRSELGNMMRCISIICDQDEKSADVKTDAYSTEEEMYDLPRGFCGRDTPVRGEREEVQSWGPQGGQEEGGGTDLKRLLNQLDHKTVKIAANPAVGTGDENGTKNGQGGGHDGNGEEEETFFSVVTTSSTPETKE